MLVDILISKVRVKIFELFLGIPNQSYHVREIVRRVGEEINAVRRELSRLEKTGFLGSEWRANRRYYSVKHDFTFLPEFLSIVNKSIGIGGAIIQNRAKLGKIKFAMLSGSFTKGQPYSPNDIDLFIVGTIVLPELSALIKEEEARRNRELNFTPMTEEEFNFRKNRRDPFVMNILSKPRIMLIGDEEELVKL
ncbi:MAG: Transcriptional regulator [Candidatus Curtissbacteria bacterium GW2011_GWA1_40_16]|uniref:Transcriptional regulator n=1 Tax=Candidatus Curtissbacteria bacterium GW2011_GWA1_40_16 TaxID=1618405 RepID=A0A0G0TL25_9BACT|nr:MAG: Transcriptional regulator [Candidatus Curtissbacteria bacterium GW2011_GWA1_40_16]